jgi:O-acetyl-ADP-ribose deacetylase (regulator of RNase III)
MDGELQFQFMNTTLRIGYADLATVEAEALVCPANIYLSMQEGVALAIRTRGGEAIMLDLRKHPLPGKIGAVLVTGAGQLPARYIFHAVSGGFLHTMQQPVLTANLMKEILSLATRLKIRHLALPLIGSGVAGGDKATALNYILDTMLHYLANHPTSLSQISVAVFAGLEPGRLAEIVSAKTAALQSIQAIIGKIQDLRSSVPDDADLQRLLGQQLAAYQQRLGQLFFFPEMNTLIDLGDFDSPQARAEKVTRLVELIADLGREEQHKREIQKHQRSHLQEYEKQHAQLGLATPPHVLIEIQELQKQLDQRDYELGQIQTQRDGYTNELQKLS